jgi:preprotein translocase subunit SecD
MRQSPTSQRTLVHDGGTRLTLRASCLPATPACDLTKQRDAAIRVLSRRLAGQTEIANPVVRADSAANIVVELPGVTNSGQVADITALLTGTGAVAILDTGDAVLQIGTSTTGKTCVSSCEAGQYRVVFTGDEMDRSQVAARQDEASGHWVVMFGFAGSVKQQFADYTASHIGQSLTIISDDIVIASPTIQSEIDGSGEITGVNETEAKRLAAYLNSGSLSAALSVVTTELFMPSGG